MTRRLLIRVAALATCASLATAGPLRAGQSRATAPAASELLLERTLAIVGGAVVTLSDASLARALALVPGSESASEADLLARLIDRWLMLHEVARFAPGEPAPATLDARLDAIRTRAGGAEALTRALAGGGRTLDDLVTWVRDDLRIAAYLDQRFASAGAPVEADITAWMQRHAAELDARGASGAEAVRLAREALVQERRASLIADWLADLHRRIDVVTFSG